MPLIQPDGEIRLLNVPFDPNYENTMYFADAQTQTAWMQMHTTRAYTALSYTRKTKNVIKVEDTMARTYDANYMMFKNTGFENRWFYAFVDKIEYINNITVEITFTIDVIQTWLFHGDVGFNECFIERQHSITDIPGENTVPENLELGEYISSPTFHHNFTPCIVVACSNAREEDGGIVITTDAQGHLYPGRDGRGSMYSGVTFIPYTLTDPNAITNLNTLLTNLTNTNKSESIISIFMGAYEFFEVGSNSEQTINLSIRTEVNGNTGYFLGDYAPRNKKLMTAPYNFLQVTDLDGHSNNYFFELFDNPLQITFKCWGNKSCQPGIMTYPLNYRGKVADYDEMVSLNNFPMCSWSVDTYKAWLAQNAGSLAVGAGFLGWNLFDRSLQLTPNPTNDIPGLIPTGTNTNFDFRAADTGPLLEPQLNINKKALAGVLALAGRVIDHATKPKTVHGGGNGNLMFQASLSLFEYTHKHIRPEYAQIIDGFFDMYGYAQHKIGLPNLHARPCYTYVKTQGCSIYGNVPADDERKIEAIFDSGIRFWDVNATFGVYNDYTNPNSPTGGGA